MATRDRTEYLKQYYQKNKERCQAINKQWRENNRDYNNKINWFWKYKECNPTQEDYDHYLSVTHCEVCGEGFTNKNKKCQDHCHTTKVLRAVICSDCNSSEGRMGTSDRAFKLYEYMQRNENKEH